MKKFARNFLLITILATMVLAFGACGDSNKSESSKNESAVEAYVAQNKSAMEQMSDDSATLSLEAEGTAVVYGYTYKNQKASEELGKFLDVEFENRESTFQEILKQMQKECPQVTAIYFRYYGNDGKLIREYIYK